MTQPVQSSDSNSYTQASPPLEHRDRSHTRPHSRLQYRRQDARLVRGWRARSCRALLLRLLAGGLGKWWSRDWVFCCTRKRVFIRGGMRNRSQYRHRLSDRSWSRPAASIGRLTSWSDPDIYPPSTHQLYNIHVHSYWLRLVSLPPADAHRTGAYTFPL